MKKMYTIEKILNNSVVIAINENDEHFLVFGKAVGYKKKQDDIFTDADVEKRYLLDERELSSLNNMSSSLPPDVISICEIVVALAHEKLNCELNSHLLLGLADHVDFAIQRMNENIIITSPLDYEIRRLYKKEYAVAKEAWTLINERLNIHLPKEEITMISLHLLNSEIGNNEITDSMTVVKISNDILNIINYHFQVVLDEDSAYVNRFIIHIRYLVLKYLNHELTEEKQFDDIYEVVINRNSRATSCLVKIMNYFAKEYGWVLTENDQIYILMHILRLINE